MRKIIYNQSRMKDKDFLKEFYQVVSKTNGLEKDVAEIVKYSTEFYNANLFFPSKDLLAEVFPELNLTEEKFIDDDEHRIYTKEKLKQLIDVHRKNLAVKMIDEKTPYQERMKILDEISRIEMSLMDNQSILSNVKDFDDTEIYKTMQNRGKGLLTGIKDIDNKTGGLNSGTITSIIAPSKAGKTTCAISICYQNLFITDNNSLFISIELPKNNLYYKLVVRHGVKSKSNIKANDIFKGELSSQQETNLHNIAKDFKETMKSELHILGSNDLKFESITTFKQQLIDMIETHNLKTIYIDHIHLIPNYKKDSRQVDREFINDFIGMIRRLSVDYDVRFITLNQLNKEGEKLAHKSEGVIDATAVDGATAIARDSTYMIGIYSTDELLKCGQMKVSLIYNRDGEAQKQPVIIPAFPDRFIVGDAVDIHKMLEIDKTKITNGRIDLGQQGTIDELIDVGF